MPPAWEDCRQSRRHGKGGPVDATSMGRMVADASATGGEALLMLLAWGGGDVDTGTMGKESVNANSMERGIAINAGAKNYKNDKTALLTLK